MRAERRRRAAPLLLATAVIAAATAASGAATETLTLEAALQRALEAGPALTLADAAAELARAQLGQARRPSNPELSVEAENVLGEGAYRDFDAAETTIALHQRMSVGGKRRARVEAAAAGVEQARLGLELARHETRREVTIAYARVLLADRLTTLARDRHAATLTLRDAVRRRVDAGLDAELQLARLEVEATTALGALNRARGEATIARRALGRWLGVETVPERLDDAWFDQPPAAPAAAAFDPEQHPLLRRQRARETELESLARLARRESIPDATLSVGVRHFADAPPGDDRALTLGVSMPLPLWDRNAVGVASARSELVQARFAIAEARRELTDAFATASAAQAAAAAELRALRESGLPAAQLAASLAVRGHEAGRLSLLERLAAERALRDVEEALERARYAARESAAQLDYLAAGSSSAP